MRVYENGTYRDMTEEEVKTFETESVKAEAEHWKSVDYDEAVNTEIRKRYSESQEFAILRQRDEKPSEYAEYFAYCEECKTYVKDKIASVQ